MESTCVFQVNNERLQFAREQLFIFQQESVEAL